MMDGAAHIAREAGLADGIYFGLSDDVYHAQPRLSASGIKNLLVSPMDFWARSWLNPAGKNDDEEPEWAIKGRAYHVRICEGREAFYQRYCKELEPPADALRTVEDLKAECRKMELAVGGKKEDLIERLLAAGCRTPIFDVLTEDYRDAHDGQIFLPADWIFDIELAAACIEKHPTLSKCFVGGYPEVSILWTAEVERNDGSGELFTVPMKMRTDYLKPAALIDLKSFANKMMKPIDRAVYYDMASHRYHIQTSVYYEGAQNLRRFVDAGKITVVSGPGPSRPWLESAAKLEKQFVFVYQQKGVAPVASGYVMPASLGLISVGNAQVREAQQTFHDCLERFGDAPWIMDRTLQQIGDDDIPQFATE